jgi:undecaprenyl diphosphate synthase
MILGDAENESNRVQYCLSVGLDPYKIPKHIAIIMDGNGRWAKKRSLPRNMGHKAGAESLQKSVKTCIKLGILNLSVYAFSTENWKRPQEEVSFLMKLFRDSLEKEVPSLNKNGAKIRIIGNIENLEESLQRGIKNAESETQHNSKINVNIMVNYGSRSELVSACKKIHHALQKKEIEDVNEHTFHHYLDVQEDPEILIRTSGEKRISNFLLWQISYAELFFVDTLWPDFGEKELLDIVLEFQNRSRRFGGVGA